MEYGSGAIILGPVAMAGPLHGVRRGFTLLVFLFKIANKGGFTKSSLLRLLGILLLTHTPLY